ncbi:MAG: sugar ABC transporter permease [Spirochaetaceae bacterium]|jgi:raffinose/stachyose/melibiose transport system permease protein|nr:sugar ABC transporter permease [Spirochaetaceae bacterium]
MKDLSSKWEERTAYIILILPAVLIYYFVMAFPTVFSVILSLTNYRGGAIFGNPNLSFAGFKSYGVIFRDPYFYMALKNNFLIVLMSVFGQIPLGFILAYILSRGLIKGTDFFQTMIYLPNVISSVVIGILFNNFFLSSSSVLAEIQKTFNASGGTSINSNPMAPVLVVMLWMYTGMYVIIFLANLQKIDVSIIEATKIDGANEWQTLRYIIFPALSGIIVTSAILAISGSLKSFDLIYVMTQGGPAHRTSVLSLYMYEKAFRGAPNYPVANAISTVMVVISFILIGVTKAVEKRFGTGEE